MRRILSTIIAILTIIFLLQGCSFQKNNIVTRDMAYDGVNNYCHENYDWTVAENNPSIMYVEVGNETDTEYQIIFHSYTGALVYFYVNKNDGKTKVTEYVPTLNIKNDLESINIYDYLDKKTN